LYGLFGLRASWSTYQVYGFGSRYGRTGGSSDASARWGFLHGIALRLCTMKKLPSGQTPESVESAWAVGARSAQSAPTERAMRRGVMARLYSKSPF